MKYVVRTSGTYRKLSKGLICMSLESQKPRMILVRKKYWRNNRKIISDLGERHKLTDLRNAMIFKQHKLKENNIKKYHSQIAKNKRWSILKAIREKYTLLIGGKGYKFHIFLIKNMVAKRQWNILILTVTQSSNQQKLHSELRTKYIFRWQNDENLSTADLVYKKWYRKMIPEGNLELQEWRKSNRNGKYLGKHRTPFFSSYML